MFCYRCSISALHIHKTTTNEKSKQRRNINFYSFQFLLLTETFHDGSLLYLLLMTRQNLDSGSREFKWQSNIEWEWLVVCFVHFHLIIALIKICWSHATWKVCFWFQFKIRTFLNVTERWRFEINFRRWYKIVWILFSYQVEKYSLVKTSSPRIKNNVSYLRAIEEFQLQLIDWINLKTNAIRCCRQNVYSEMERRMFF